MSEAAEPDDKQERMNRLERALGLFLAHSQAGGDLGGTLEQDAELRELLEPMLAGGDDAEEVPASLGRVLRDFRLVREIGRGGMGIVWEAEQTSLGRRVALKILPEARTLSAAAVARFRREAATLAALDHPGIVKAHAIDTDGETHFFAMEFVEGAPLDRVLATLAARAPDELDSSALRQAVAATAHRRAGDATDLDTQSAPGAWERRTWVTAVVGIVAQVADALAHAHALGVVHRDVKPANILLRADGRAVLTDFGLARRSDTPALTLTGDLAGTPFYMAPEQIDGAPVDQRADVFALGVVLYEALTLRRPFDGDTSRAVFERITRSEPRDPRRWSRAVPEDLAAIVLKAIEKEPARRYQQASDLADDLRAFLEHRPVRARRATALDRARRFVRREPLKASFIAVLAVGGTTVAGLAAYLIGRTPEIRIGEEVLRAPEVDDALVIGYAETDEGLRSSARAAFEHALALAPRCLEGILGLALLTERESGPSAALAWLDGYLKAHAADLAATPPLRRLRAMLLHRSGDSMRSQDELRDQPPLATATDHFLAGVTHLHLGHRGHQEAFARAEHHLRRAVLLSSRPSKLYYFEWAHAAGHAGDAKISADVEAAIVSKWPDSARGQLWLGFALRDTDSDRALKAFEEAVRREPDWGFAWQFLSTHLLHRQDALAACRAAERAAALRPDVPILWEKLGSACMAVQNPVRALEAFEQAIALSAADAGGWSGKASALNALGRHKEAVPAGEKAAELDPKSSFAWFVQGHAWHALGRHQRALPLLEKAVELQAENPNYWSMLGLVQSRLRDHEAAAAAFRRALDLRPDNANDRCNLAVQLNALGETEAAHQELQAVLQRDPGFGFAHRMLLLISRRANEGEKALRHAQAWTQAAAKDPEAWLWLGRTLLERQPAGEADLKDARQAAERASTLLAELTDPDASLVSAVAELRKDLEAR